MLCEKENRAKNAPSHRTHRQVGRTAAHRGEQPLVQQRGRLVVDGGQHLLGQPRDVLFLAQNMMAATGPEDS